MFSKGDSVKVNKGVSISDMEDIDFTDWQGRIIGFIESEEVKGEYLIEIEWDSITLRNMPEEYIEQSMEEGYEIETFILEKGDVTKTKARDKVHDRLTVLNEMYYPLDDDDKNIAKILGTQKIDVNTPNLRKFLTHIKRNISHPCILAGIESMGDFDWEEKFQFGYGSKNEYENLRRIKPSLQDEFELLEFLDKEIDEYGTIPVKVKRVSDKKQFTLCLDGLKPVNEESNNYAIIHEFVVWFVNY